MIKKYVLAFMQSTRYSSHILMKSEFSRWIFEKRNSSIKFHKNLSRGNQDVPCGRTERQTVATKLIVAFRNFAYASKRSDI